MPSAVRRLAELSGRDALLVAQLLAGALGLVVAVRLVPLRRLTAVLGRRAEGRWLRWLPLGHARSEMPHLARLVDLAARAVRGERRCLVRSLLLFWLLRARRQPVTLLLGVEKAGGMLRAHAWLDAPGTVAADADGAPARYAMLVRL